MNKDACNLCIAMDGQKGCVGKYWQHILPTYVTDKTTQDISHLCNLSTIAFKPCFHNSCFTDVRNFIGQDGKRRKPALKNIQVLVIVMIDFLVFSWHDEGFDCFIVELIS